MTAILTAVPATDTGIVCGRCSTRGRNGRTVRHATVAAVRLCSLTPSTPSDVTVRMTSLPAVPGSPVPTVAPLTPVGMPGTPELAAGRYAVRDGEGVVKFFKIDRPTDGKWAGYTFVLRQAGDDFHLVKDRAKRISILSAILVDPRGATVLYGRELGVCGVCGRTLTDEQSRSAGIGPVCAGK